MDPRAQELIDHFGMTPLPVEATFFVSTYRSTAELDSGTPIGTAMLGLFTADPPSRSLFHRLTFDEVWHFHLGDPLRLVLLYPDGSSGEVVLGADVLAGQRVQFVVPAGVWQAGELVGDGRWALFGCTMAPGFVSSCFEGGRVAALLDAYPDRHDDIARLGIPEHHDSEMPADFAT